MRQKDQKAISMRKSARKREQRRNLRPWLDIATKDGRRRLVV